MAPPRQKLRNTSAQSWCADVGRFLRLINTDGVSGTHKRPPTRLCFEFRVLLNWPTRLRTRKLLIYYYTIIPIFQQQIAQPTNQTAAQAQELYRDPDRRPP